MHVRVLFLALLLSAVAAVTACTQPAPEKTTSSGAAAFSRTPVDTLRDAADRVFIETNAERATAGLSRLRRDTALRALACRHARDMLVRKYMGHVNPDGLGPRERGARYHRRLIGPTGENVLSRTGPSNLLSDELGDHLVDQWMGSPPHRENILSPVYTHLGVCVVQHGDRLRATQSFAAAQGYLAAPLPYRLPAGERVSVAVRPVAEGRRGATQYDLWSPAEKRRVFGPHPLSDSLRAPDTTATVRVRFYFPQAAGQYRVCKGPSVHIAPPDTAQKMSARDFP